MFDAFVLVSEQTGTLEEIIQTFDDGVAFCRIWMERGELEFPLNVEINEFVQRPIAIDETLNFKLTLYPTEGGEIFRDEAEFNREKKNRFAAESVIPCGGVVGELYVEDSSALICGKILDVRMVMLDNVKSIHIKLGCLGFVFDAFFDDETLPYAECGNVLCCVYDTIGLLID